MRAFTLVELMISSGILIALLGSAMTVAFLFQRTFLQSESYSSGQNDQMRVMDYISRDIRNAIGVSVENSGTKLTLYIPNDYNSSGDPFDPTISGSGVVYDSVNRIKTVSFYREGDGFIREDGGLKTALADELTVFGALFSAGTITVGSSTYVGPITTTLTFSPKFVVGPSQATRDGTTMLTVTRTRNLASVGPPSPPSTSTALPTGTKKKKK